MKKLLIAAVVGGSALLVAVLVVGVMILNTMQQQADEADYRSCMTAQGVYQSTNEDDMIGMAKYCYASVYGD